MSSALFYVVGYPMEKTLRKERQILNLFKEFIEKRGNCSLEEILKDEKELQDVLIQFFDTLSKMKGSTYWMERIFDRAAGGIKTSQVDALLLSLASAGIIEVQ